MRLLNRAEASPAGSQGKRNKINQQPRHSLRGKDPGKDKISAKRVGGVYKSRFQDKFEDLQGDNGQGG